LGFLKKKIKRERKKTWMADNFPVEVVIILCIIGCVLIAVCLAFLYNRYMRKKNNKEIRDFYATSSSESDLSSESMSDEYVI
jgi:nitrate reductase gamma subunit